MFEKAARLKLRFQTAKGALTVEDLWDLPLRGNGLNLDRVAIALSRQIRDEDTESFVLDSKRGDSELKLRFEVVKHIIDVRLAEEREAKAKADARNKKDRLLEIIAKKQDQQLEASSVDDLLKMVEAL